jgi:hypothetical protein
MPYTTLKFNCNSLAGHRWLMSEILATLCAEIGRMKFDARSREKVYGTPNSVG